MVLYAIKERLIRLFQVLVEEGKDERFSQAQVMKRKFRFCRLAIRGQEPVIAETRVNQPWRFQ
jgi:hypothetical protein